MTPDYRPLRWLPLWRALGIAYVGAIVVLSLLPPGDLPVDPGLNDKLWHAAGYAAAAVWTVWVVQPGRGLVIRLLALTALGIALEFAQQASGIRHGDPLDAIANAAGVIAGGCVAWTPLARVLQGIDGRLLRRRAV